VVLERQSLREADFSGRRLDSFSSMGCRFERCCFDGAYLRSASFGAGREVSTYTDCSFDGSRLIMGPGGYARFVRCSFVDADIREWSCFCVELVDCKFSGRIERAFFNGTPLKEDRRIVRRAWNEFRDNDFSGCDLIEVDFRTGIDLSLQRLPIGPEYMYIPDGRSALARLGELAGSGDDKARKGFVTFLQWLVDGGQEQLHLRENEIAEYGQAVVDVLRAFGAPRD